MYIQDTITMDILNPKETITCRPGAPGPLFTTGPPVLPQATPPVAGPGCNVVCNIICYLFTNSLCCN